MNLNLSQLYRTVSHVGRNLSVSSKSLVAGGKYGQPTEWTHPHIIGPGEVNKGVLKIFNTDRF